MSNDVTAAATAAPSLSFRGWLREQQDDQGVVGDLARDVVADASWPRAEDSLERYREHLEGQGACVEALEALDLAWARYRAR